MLLRKNMSSYTPCEQSRIDQSPVFEKVADTHVTDTQRVHTEHDTCAQ